MINKLFSKKNRCRVKYVTDGSFCLLQAKHRALVLALINTGDRIALEPLIRMSKAGAVAEWNNVEHAEAFIDWD